MTRYNGSGWHFQHTRHSNARKYGRAGGNYAGIETYPTLKGHIFQNLTKHIAKHTMPDGTIHYDTDTDNQIFKTRKEADEHIKKYETELIRKKHFGGYTPNMIKGGLADGVNPNNLNQEALAKGVSVELEHTKNPVLAREIATDHLVENSKYYDKLEKVEGKVEPIKIKISHKEIRRDKNKLEKDLLKEINQESNIEEKKKLEHLYRELRKADNHSKIKRFYEEYGSTLKTLGMAIPFYFVAPLITAGVVLGATITGDVPANLIVTRLAFPLATSLIGTLGVKYSVRTLQAIKKREKEIIAEKSKELRDNTTLPTKEIKVIAKRVAQQELHNTKLVHELTL